MERSKNMKEIRTKHPFPWSEEIRPDGRVRMLDATGNEVGLFELTALAVILTTAWAAQGVAA